MLSNLLSIETRPNAFFRKIDWTAFWSATIIAFLVYFFTLGPSVGLEDSGELATAAAHLGVPHPPGYPFWTFCSLLVCKAFSFVTYMGHPTPAWATSLLSAVFGALAAGCTAMLICRSAQDFLRDEAKPWLCFGGGVGGAGGLPIGELREGHGGSPLVFIVVWVSGWKATFRGGARGSRTPPG